MKQFSISNIFGVIFFLFLFLATHICFAQAFRVPDAKIKTPATKNAKQNKKVQEKIDTATTPAPDKPEIVELKNLKILSELSDGKGNIVRVIQYDKGVMRITETIIKPKPIMIGNNSYAVNPDTMKKEMVLLVVDKSKYSVQVIYRKRMIRAYKATFGPNPKQNKCMEGDRCTPEGSFTITNLNPKSRFNKFMLISYPNDSTKERFNRLKKSGVIPSSAKIGGDIGIHGIWNGGDQLIELGVGWTDGCVALKNRDVEELFTMVGVGTKVLIKQ